MKLSIVITFLLIANALAFTLMCIDKWKAKKGARRIKETTFFIVALCFGAAGIYLGMISPVSHKSSKVKFKLGIPICFILNLLSFYFMEKYFLDISI